MRIFTITWGVILLGLRLNADPLLYMINYGNVGFTNLPYVSGATDSTILTPSQTMIGSAGGTGAYSAYLSFGHLGLNVSGSTPTTNNGTAYLRNNLSAFSDDSLTIGGVSSGTLQLSYLVDGTLTYDGSNLNNAVFAEFVLNQGALVDYAGLNASGSTVENGSLTPDGSLANTWDYSASGTVDLAIVNGEVSLGSQLEGYVSCTSGLSCTQSVNFLNTALLGGAVVLDSNGNVVQGATITSQSGHDYTQPLTPGPVPEPASWLLLASVLAVAFAFRHRHSRTAV
jgi:hypothetical protein